MAFISLPVESRAQKALLYPACLPSAQCVAHSPTLLGMGVQATAQMPTEEGAHVHLPPLLQLFVHFSLLQRDSRPASCGVKSDRTITLVSRSQSKKWNMPALRFIHLLLVLMLTLAPIANLK